MADFEDISILYDGIKKMVKSQTVRSINKLVARLSSLMHCFAAIVGSIGENKMDITRPPLNGYLSEIRFCAQENMSWWKKVLPAYCHFN